MEPVNSGSPCALSRHGGSWRAALAVDLIDRPGALSDLASLAGRFGVNIERLLYDRGTHPNRVELGLSCESAVSAAKVLDSLASRGLLDSLPGKGSDTELITDVAGVLSFKVTLENRPGALAALAGHFKELEANVIHMCYDISKDRDMAEVSVATSGARQVSSLLRELTRAGYHYHVLWRGGDDSDVDEALGLSGVEAFLFKLRHVLPPERMNTLEELFSTSQEIRQALADFRSASGVSGEALAASEVFSNILRLAAMAVGTTGERFTLRLTGPVRLTLGVSLYMISCPEGANSYLLCHKNGLAMLDTNFGVYFEDVMAWLSNHGFDPARIDTVLATHPDADHAGWTGRLQTRYGARVLMHPESARVFAEEDRTLGRGTLKGINGPFTRLVVRLSDLVPPQSVDDFEPAGGDYGGFPVIGKVRVADLELMVLESLGGHSAGQVFYFNPYLGVLFSGDYLLDAASLSPREREALSVHKSLLTSTNADSAIFSKEMGMLKALMKKTDTDLAGKGKRAMIFPGHGDFYGVEQAGW